jgi:hypothetical protein
VKAIAAAAALWLLLAVPAAGARAAAGCRMTWSVVASPAVRGAELRGVAAAAPNDVWAVGGPSNFESHAATPRALVEHFDGKRWTVVHSPTVAGVLEGVAVAGPRDVWAVGELGSFTSRTGQPPPAHDAPIEHWNGSRWMLTRVTGVRRISAVAATSPHDVWAVGTDAAGAAAVLHWNGSRWSQFHREHAELFALTAVSPGDVWAVGDENGDHFLELHWNGARWSAYSQSPPNGGFGLDPSPELAAVSATSGHDVWAAGIALNSGEPAWADTVLMHWNGSGWTTVSTKSSWMWVDALAARASGDVLLSGVTSNGDAYGQAAAQLWQNNAWQAAMMDDRRLEGLAGDRAGVWGVGFTGSAADAHGFPTAATPVIERGRCTSISGS